MMKLKPCPFCGGEAKLWSGNIDDDYYDVYYDVYCMACNCMTPKFHTEESAITFWNRREPIDKIVESLEAERTKAAANYNSSIGSHAIESCGRMYGFQKSIEIVKGGAV